MLKLVSALLLFVTASLFPQSSAKLLRHPALNHDGSELAFSYQGDIWKVPASGGTAQRLTIHEGNEAHPRFSPDGSQIVFSGIRFGNSDLFVIPASGGQARRLTWNSAPDLVSAWTKDGNILFGTVREFNHVERDPEVYTISPSGGTEYRLLDALGSDATPSPDGRFIAMTIGGSNPVYREGYTGPANKNIWLYDTKKNTYTNITPSAGNELMPQWTGNRSLVYISSANGKYNVYKMALSEEGQPQGSPEKLTDFKDYAVRYFTVSGDGKHAVIEQGTSLWIMKNFSKPEKLNITVPADNRFDPEELKSFTKDANEYEVSPNGKLVALVNRGEIFIKEVNKDKSRSVNVSDHPFRDMNPAWLNDSTLLFVSDREDDNFDLYILRSADKAEPNPFRSLRHEVIRITKTGEDESRPVVSPDGKKVAFMRGRGTFIVAEINKDGSLGKETVLHDGWASADDVAWSPDSRWVAYSMSDLYFNDDVYIHAADNSQPPVNVSMHPRGDSNPVWSPDGSKLGFISARNGRNNDVWFAWLKKEDWERTKQDWEDKEPAKKDDKPAGKKDSAKVTPVVIDFDNIHERLTQVTSFPGNENNLRISKDGETFYYTAASSSAKGNDLYSIKWDGKDLKELTKGGQNPMGLSGGADGAYIYYLRTGGALSRHDLKSDKAEALPYILKMKIDYEQEKQQVFAEAWRTLRDGFYDPDFHGKNWEALREKYLPLCMAASTEGDFREMFNWMLGELNSSHMGLSGGDRVETQKETTGLLGAELKPVKNGAEVLRVIPGSPADRSSSRLMKGDIIRTVGGQQISDEVNIYSLFTGTADEQVLLGVEGKDGKTREVVIRPAATLRTQIYKEWVADRKALTDKYSGGKLGYIHIRGMDMVSFEEFERELTAAGYGKEGLVIDVRYNGGGSTTDLLMAILNYKQHAYTIPRGAADNLEKEKTKFRPYYPTGERLVYTAWLKPSIALCNESSYSNAEIFSHAYKNLGIGTLVGKPTNGSVISTGGRGLMDGSFVRLPFRGWYTLADDKNQEVTGPAVPHILVDTYPDSKAKGVDEQLKRAVEELLR